MIYVFLAEGFEQIEALTPVDILRRAVLQVVTVKIQNGSSTLGRAVKSSHDVIIEADMLETEIRLGDVTMVVLPGGLPGSHNLYASLTVKLTVEHCVANKIPIGAICAAPSILARYGCLRGINATSHPSFRHFLDENEVIFDAENKVVTDGIFTTAAAAGVSLPFAFELLKVLKGKDSAKEIAELIMISDEKIS